jgi:general secretion pathway protein F
VGRFQYRAMTPSGDVFDDVMEAPDRDAVIARLRDRGDLPINVVDAILSGDTVVSGRAPVSALRTRRSKPVSGAVLALATRQLGTLIDSGLSIPQSLEIVGQASDSERIAVLARSLHHKVRQGMSLSEAMGPHEDVFDTFYRAMVEAGEAGGVLGESLGRLAGYLEKSSQLRSAVHSALIYPAVLLSVALVSVVILVAIVLPQFETLLRNVPGTLPLPTRLVFATAEFMRTWGPVTLAGLLLGGYALRLWLRDVLARRWFDRSLLSLPLVGRLVTLIEFERVLRSLSALVNNGVGLTRAIELVTAVAHNRAVSAAVRDVNLLIKQGERLSDALGTQPVVPRLAVQLIKVGEESGALAAMLLRLADMFAQDVEITLRRLVSIIEPALIVLIGLLVATIVLSLLTAIVGINAIIT